MYVCCSSSCACVARRCDVCPNKPSWSSTDSDGDTVGNECDNCVNVANTNQLDSDADTVGDGELECDACTRGVLRLTWCVPP
jgi:hypothetical protein